MPVSCTRVPGAWPMISSFALAAARTTGRGPSGSSAAQSRQARASAMIRPSSRSAFEDLPAIAEYPLDEGRHLDAGGARSEEHTSELQSLMRNSYAVFCLKKKKKTQ